MVCAETFPTCHRTAVEPRPEELEHLKRHYHYSVQGKLEHAAPHLDTYQLIAGNPPFTPREDFVRTLRPLLALEGLLVLMGLSSWGQAEASAQFFREHTPLYQWRLGGRLGFRGVGGGNDFNDVSWWLWCAGETMNSEWRVRQLPPLSKDERRWRIRPGTEYLVAT